MGNSLLIPKKNGYQIAAFSTSTGTNPYKANAWALPDYQAHDPATECIEVKKIELEINPAALAGFLAGVAQNWTLYMGWRSGSFAAGFSAIPDWGGGSDNAHKWLFKSILTKQAVAAAAQAIAQFGGILDYSDEPVIANPTTNTFAFWGDSSGAAVLVDDYAIWRMTYRWIPAKTAELQSYLSWEALG